jgi:hypothetical protein
VISYTVRVERIRKEWADSKRGKAALNRIFREALTDVAAFWIEHILPTHFGNQATALYGYRFRSDRYLKRKRRLRPDLIPPAPFELSGQLKDYVMTNAQSGRMLANSKPVATSSKIRVTIPVRIPHPIHPKNRGELSRLNRSDRRQMRRYFMMRLKARIAEAPQRRTVEIIRPAAA